MSPRERLSGSELGRVGIFLGLLAQLVGFFAAEQIDPAFIAAFVLVGMGLLCIPPEPDPWAPKRDEEAD